MYTRSSASLEYVLVPIIVKEAGLVINPTADVVEMAFTNEGVAPVESDWKTGSWEADTLDQLYYARCLVGPNGVISLAAQVWDTYVRISDQPERPVLAAGQIRVI